MSDSQSSDIVCNICGNYECSTFECDAINLEAALDAMTKERDEWKECHDQHLEEIRLQNITQCRLRDELERAKQCNINMAGALAISHNRVCELDKDIERLEKEVEFRNAQWTIQRDLLRQMRLELAEVHDENQAIRDNEEE